MEHPFFEEYQTVVKSFSKKIFTYIKENPDCSYEDVLRQFNIKSKKTNIRRWLAEAEFEEYRKIVKENSTSEKKNICTYVGQKGSNKGLRCSKKCKGDFCPEHKSRQPNLASPLTVINSPTEVSTSSETDDNSRPSSPAEVSTIPVKDDNSKPSSTAGISTSSEIDDNSRPPSPTEASTSSETDDNSRPSSPSHEEIEGKLNVLVSRSPSPESVEIETEDESDAEFLDNFSPKPINVVNQWISKTDYLKNRNGCTFVKNGNICCQQVYNPGSEEKKRRCEQHKKNLASNKFDKLMVN